MSVQSSVQARYADGAKEVQAELCCPVDYDPGLLKVLPQEIIEKDYGCGDPSRYVRKGDVVLDLGSGGGKICYMAAQLVGDQGRVVGIDMTDDMLALARKYMPEMLKRIGGQCVEFHKGYIQDLALNVSELEAYVANNPVSTSSQLEKLEKWKVQQRSERPLIADNSVDLVISNCVLNLVAEHEKRQLVQEIYRVLKPGGRVAISDIVSDEIVPEHLKNDTNLWSGCISGAFQEKDFLEAFIENGFIAVGYDKWDAEPWQIVEGIEFRSVTLVGIKAHPSECMDRGHAVIYKGPYATITDDEGYIYRRGERMAVSERTFNALTKLAPYKNDFIAITPYELKNPIPWCAPPGTTRPVSETKDASHAERPNEQSGGNGSGCCG